MSGTDRAALATAEAPIEVAVSEYLAQMPFLLLSINDEAGPHSLRGFVERNVIALASHYQPPCIDPPSSVRLGRASNREKVRRSGLWNQRHGMWTMFAPQAFSTG